jgi:Putative beta-barrel porin 2
VLASRLQPFIGGGETNSRTRPSGEIDTRAEQRQRELSGGLAFALGPHSKIYGAASQSSHEFFNAIEDGVDLSETLNQDATNYSAGLQTALTPLTTLTVSGSFQQDRFEFAPLRDADTSSVTASVRIATDAVISGNIGVSYINFEPVDPLVEPYQGLQAEAGVIYPLVDIGRLSFSLIRGIEYSYDQADGYYEELSTSLSYTHFLFGEVDFQVRGSKSWFDYGAREGSVARKDTQDSVAAGVGYNLRNRTRISVNYEFAKRRSPAYADRNYDRTRIYLAWAYAF